MSEAILTASAGAGLTERNLFVDPYPLYARLRRDAPVHVFEETGETLITRWADCRTVGANDGIFLASSKTTTPEARVFGMPNILSMSGNPHAALRLGIDKSLRPEVVSEYIETMARPFAQQFVAEVQRHGRADLTPEIFERVSVRVVAAVLGLGEIDSETLVRWFSSLNQAMQGEQDDPRINAAFHTACSEIDAVLGPVVERLTVEPDQSLLSHMVHGGMPDGQHRTYADISPTIRVFLLGGLQEPGHGAANAALGVLQDPQLTQAITRDPASLALRAYDEGLRWIAPIGGTSRMATRDFELAGTRIPEGASVLIVLASANRDETFFENADQFQVDRQRRQHASFGYRPHYCAGHALGRAIGRITLEEVFGSLSNIRLDPENPPETRGWRFRAVARLPVLWDA